MQPTKEQEEILDIIYEGTGDVRINAYAGTGKTTTLKMIVNDNPDSRFLYLAFNKAVAKEAEKKFPDNCRVTTVHGLAYRNVVPNLDRDKFHKKLQNFWKTKDYMYHFKIQDRLKGMVPGWTDLFTLSSDIRKVVSNFKNSDAGQITADMLNFGSFKDDKRYQKGLLSTLVIDIANEIWQAEIDMDSPVPMDHNTYLKMWEVNEPTIVGYDFILFDEAQDANPVMLSIIEKVQGVRKIFVGDTFQAIYGWNGAVNAMSIVDVEHDCYLTKSWRFGDAVAAEGNRILKLLADDIPPLEGNSDIKSVCPGEVNEEEQYTVIFRTNGALAKYAVEKLQAEKKVYVEGGVTELCNDLLALYMISRGEQPTTMSKYRPYKKYSDVLQEAIVDMTIKRDIAFINEYAERTPEVLELLKKETLSKRSIKKANVLLTTAHKSKGLEFNQVILWEDFKYEEVLAKLDKYHYLDREEMNLLYVSVTRAQNVLSLGSMYEAFMTYLTGRFIGEV